ncbi:MAG: hypothetical protein OHK93_005623 [Ramalina farinacea]|uniref:S1-like domain-containing protein n=1 Tax=Ramalina farinacea TaxID=258253 RepID=A0AA43QLA7_9LECA|nr:hypothetical protein [Ramalina farinacea]
MGKPKRQVLATAEQTLIPPIALEDNHVIAKIVKDEGKNLWAVKAASAGETLLVELPARFRSTIWLKRGGYVLVDTTAFEGRENKLDGEIVNVVRDEKSWRKQPYWPQEFSKSQSYLESSDDESRVGKMPPADASDEETYSV